MQRNLLPLAILATALLATWALWRSAPSPPEATTTAAVAPSPVASPTVPVVEVDPRRLYRLAGTAVGDPSSYAAIELPDGSSNLYKEGATVPGLGRIDEIHADHVKITYEGGETVLHLKPAPTATPDPRQLGRARKRAPAAPRINPDADPAGLDDTTDESDLGDDPDRPAF